MATSGEASCNVASSKESQGTLSSWAGIVGGGKIDSTRDSSKVMEEHGKLTSDGNEVNEVTGGASEVPIANHVDVPDEELDPSELAQFTEIRNRKDRLKKKSGRGNRRGGGGGRGRDRDYYEIDSNRDPKGQTEKQDTVTPRGRGKRMARETTPKLLNGPIDREDEVHEPGSPEGSTCDEEKERVHYVPAPAPKVNVWEKRQGVPVALSHSVDSQLFDPLFTEPLLTNFSAQELCTGGRNGYMEEEAGGTGAGESGESALVEGTESVARCSTFLKKRSRQVWKDALYFSSQISL
ncbi:hypothetical protein SK128_019985 [Halocaridina rubra]|uniref:Uncharacterized protein n=1 Tax=Halocaridina rubra TaxID=373956 RepID=A0AAN8ZXV7_HALRR